MPAETAVLHRWDDIPSEALTSAIGRKYITGAHITIARFELARGGGVPRHAHESEQVTSVVRGALRFLFDGQDIIVRAGEVLRIPGWLAHEVHVIEDTLAIDVFSPVRQDWLEGSDTYFRQTPNP